METNAKSVLGIELINVLSEACAGDKQELETMINEAMSALKEVKKIQGWAIYEPVEDEE